MRYQPAHQSLFTASSRSLLCTIHLNNDFTRMSGGIICGFGARLRQSGRSEDPRDPSHSWLPRQKLEHAARGNLAIVVAAGRPKPRSPGRLPRRHDRTLCSHQAPSLDQLLSTSTSSRGGLMLGLRGCVSLRSSARWPKVRADAERRANETAECGVGGASTGKMTIQQDDDPGVLAGMARR
jgi:hypothetical protein